MRIYQYILAGTIFFATSCNDFFDQTISIDQPEYEKQLVIHSYLSNRDSSIEITLSRNHGILEPIKEKDWYLENGTIELYKNGELSYTLNPLPQSASFYTAQLPPDYFEAGSEYILRASHADFPTMEAKQVFPEPVILDSVRLREDARFINGESYASADVYFHDNPDERNFYQIQLEEITPLLNPIYDPNGNFIGFDTIGENRYFIYPDDSEDPNANLGMLRSIIVSDELFNGEAYKMTFLFYYYGFDPARYRVHVSAITEDFYLYSRTAYQKYDVDGIPLVEPVTVHGNFDAGIGIFGLQNTTIRDLE